MCLAKDRENNQTSDVSADIYLFTNSEYSKYEQAYTNAHSEDLWWEDFDESISDIPPGGEDTIHWDGLRLEMLINTKVWNQQLLRLH